MPKYTVEALRTIRTLQAQHETAGHTAQAEQMRKVGDQVEAMQAENERLRAIISEATAAVGNGSCCSTQASIEFMAGLPKEIALNSAAIRAELEALKKAVRPIARGWGMVKQQGEYAALNCAGSGYRLSAETLDALAALVGEE